VEKVAEVLRVGWDGRRRKIELCVKKLIFMWDTIVSVREDEIFNRNEWIFTHLLQQQF